MGVFIEVWRHRRRFACRIVSAVIAVLALTGVAGAFAQAQESVTTNRATELRANPDDSATSLASLPPQSKVQVIERKGAWSKVKTDTQSGWVRMMHLRGGVTLEEAPQSGSKSNSGGFLAGFNRLLGGNQQTNQRAQSATVGIRGLSAEELKTASPNPQALAEMKSFVCNKPDAEKFAKEVNLAKVEVADPGEAPRGGRR